MKNDKNNIDDLFRRQLGNKEMKPSNPGFQFTPGDASVRSLPGSQNWFVKISQFLKNNKISYIVISAIIGSIIFFFIKEPAGKQGNNTAGMDSVRTKSSLVTTTPVDSISNDTLVDNKAFTEKNTGPKYNHDNKKQAEAKDPVITGHPAETPEKGIKTDKKTETENLNTASQDKTEKPDTLNRKDSLQSSATKDTINQPVTKKTHINNTEKQPIMKPEITPTDSIDNTKKNRKRKVKKLR